MRFKHVAGICAALLVAACPSNKEQKKPGPVTAKAPASEPASKASTPETNPQSAAATPASAPQTLAGDAQALAKGLVEGRDQVGYSSSKQKVAYAESYNEEGNGAGLKLVFVGEDGKTGREEIEVYTPSDDSEAKIKAALPKIAARLAADGYEGLPKTEWPEKQEMVSPFSGLEISWRGRELIAARAGEGTNIKKKKLAPEKPFQDLPTAVYTSRMSPVIVVQVVHDPGSAYAEGFNVFTTYEILPMPQVQSH